MLVPPLHTGVQVASAETDLLELTEENVEKVLDEVSSPGAALVRFGGRVVACIAPVASSQVQVLPHTPCSSCVAKHHWQLVQEAREQQCCAAAAAQQQSPSPHCCCFLALPAWQVRPYLMADGGNVEFVEIDGLVVRLKLAGACGSCPSSLTTMTMGIKRRLMEKIPVRQAGRQ